MINEMLEAFLDPRMRHAMLVHLPIVLAVLALPLTLAAALRRDDKTLRVLTLIVYLAFAGAAYVTAESGEDAEAAIDGELSEEAYATLEDHEELAETLWMLGLAAAVPAAFALAGPQRLRLVAPWAALVLGVVATGWVAAVAHHGGTLVYVHGVNTPSETGAPGPGRGADAVDPRVAYFEQEVHPLLVENCFQCHNPAREASSGGLDQTTIAGLLEGGWSGPALVPGRPGESLMIERVRSDDPDWRMPPEGAPLSEEQIDALERWIREGAVWSEPRR
jgi:uncharacterized membrane protein